MSGHTPGPWEVGGFSGTDVTVPPRQVTGPDGKQAWAVSIVASVHNPDTDDFGAWTQDKSGEHADPVVKANAHLIAAAPDLLAAAERVLGASVMENVRGGEGWGGAMTGLDAAVGKAKGEAP